MNIYLDLYTTFFKIGLFTFGGGYAMLPMLERETVNNKHWTTYDELMDYFAIGQCTPGIIAVNTATFIGYYQKKIPGALAATAGVISPSIVIIMLIASLLTNFAGLPIIQHALAGIRIAVCVLILQAVLKLFKNGVKDWFQIALFVLALVCACFSLISSVFIVIIAGAAGIAFKILREQKAGKKEAGHD